MGGKSYVVSVRVEPDAMESRVLQSGYSVYDTLKLGDKFADIKGFNSLGYIDASDLIGRNKAFKFSTIQLAGDFISMLKKELGGFKDQIVSTANEIEALGRRYEVEI
jgi:hypothetical protein